MRLTSVLQNLCRLYQYRELLIVWSLREIRVRYKQSILGSAWAIAQPLSLMLIFSTIFTVFVKIPTADIPYPIFAYIALLPWVFFSTSITFAVTSLTNQLNLVTKVYFPREIMPAASVAASLADFLIASVVFIGMMLYYQIPVTGPFILLPVLMLIQVMLVLGIALIVSAMNVFYRDLRFVVPLVLQLWMYATPIIYPSSLVPERYRTLYLLNPMASLIEGYRLIALQGKWPDLGSIATVGVTSCLVLIVGYMFFKREEWRFADII
jgi:lipopolysaccharide transport system permease protein